MQGWTHTYKGLIKCAGCGCAITAETKTKHYKTTKRTAIHTYYRCTRRRGPCDQPGVTAEELEEMLKHYISQINIDQQEWELGMELLQAKYSHHMDLQVQIRQQLQSQYENVDQELAKLLKLRMNEEITAEEYADSKKDLIDRKVSNKDKIADHQQGTDNWLERAENFVNTCFRAKETMEGKKPEPKKELVSSVGWNLVLNEKRLLFEFKPPFDLLIKPEARSDMQGRKESNPRLGFWRARSYH